MSDEREQHELPPPDPALRELDFLVGRWSIKGALVGSDEENIVGEASYEWLPGGYFLRQHIRMDFAGFVEVDSEEMIGYNPEKGRFDSWVFSNVSPVPLPYEWEVKNAAMKISVSHGALDAKFNGRVSEDGNSFSGGWRPNPGADESVNVPYDISGSRLD
jgi:hypothetical protein